MPNSAPLKVVSVMSPPYSGSTLLALLLSTHPEVGTLGEGQKFFAKVLRKRKLVNLHGGNGPLTQAEDTCSCGAKFVDCPFWSELKKSVIQRVSPAIYTINFTRFNLHYRVPINNYLRPLCLKAAFEGRLARLPWPVRNRFDAVAQANEIFMRLALERAGGSVYLESTKNLAITTFLNGSARFDVFTIHLLRDGRAQTVSGIKRNPHLTYEQLCERWRDQVNEQLHFVNKAHGAKCLRVRYEDLCAEPERRMREVFAFCGLDSDRGSLDFRSGAKHIMGNYDVRFGDVSEIKDKQAWRQQITPEQGEIFERVAGDLNRSLGYE